MDQKTTLISYLEQIITSVHPLMAEGMYLAAVPSWYNQALFSMMRNRDDGRDEGLVERLTRYSFVIPVEDADREEPIYAVRPEERAFLQRYWIAKNPAAYRAAHRQALAYWRASPDPNPFAQAQNRVYHQLFVDIQGGMDFLVETFRAYHSERQLGAIDRLLETVGEARFYLAILGSESLAQLDSLLAHLRARLAQLRGNWSASLDALQELRQKEDQMSSWLQPYVARAYGYALAHTGQYVEAIEQHQIALDLFTRKAATISNSASFQAERAYTMIALGEAHVGLAAAVRGHSPRRRPSASSLGVLRDFFYFFLSLPLVFYLSLTLGRRVWHPRFWPMLQELDWIVARLFATGASLYTRADPILESHGLAAEAVLADEQLANLYLALGDADRSQQIFSALLTDAETPVGEYRQAIIRLGLADALLTLGRSGEALDKARQALPVLDLYEDTDAHARGEVLLAEAAAASGDPAMATTGYQHVLHHLTAQGEITLATDVAHRLEEIAAEPSVPAEQRKAAAQTAAGVTERRYPVAYRHPSTAFFQRAAVGLLAALVFLILVSTVRLETGIRVAPVITFNASPLLRADTPDFAPDLSQGVNALSLSTTPNPQLLLWLGALLLVGYLAVSTAVGIAAIVRTSLTKVQATARSGAVVVSDQALRVGEGETQRIIPLADAIRFSKADLYFVNERLVDDSTMLLASSQKRIRLSGNTAWYAALQARLDKLLPEHAARSDDTYHIIRSRMGGFYLVSLVLLLGLALLGRIAPGLTAADLPVVGYSLTDIYPMLYLGLFLPPVWWFVVQPLRVRLGNDPTSRYVWWLGGAGALLALLRVVTRFRPWITVPDIYSSLLILSLIVAAAAFIWRARRPDAGGAVYAPLTRIGAAAVAAALLVLIGLDLGREAGAYHFRVQGDAWRDRALGSLDAAEKTIRLKDALAAYNQSLAMADRSILGIDGRAGWNIPLGIPSAAQFTWVNALENRAAVQAQLEDYAAAINDYTELLAYRPEKAELYASRAIAYLGLGTTPGDEMGTVEVARQIFDAALTDFDTSIELKPDDGGYYLWRGVAYHGLGVDDRALVDYQQALTVTGANSLSAAAQAKAWTGQGWLAFSRGAFEESVMFFNEAAAADGSSVEARLGLGYARYSLRQYEEALQAWSEAADLDPESATAFISLGTLYWRVGTLGSDYNASGSDRCASDALTDAEKKQSAAYLQDSIASLSQSTGLPGQADEEVAFTYRTMGQVQFLLRSCPGFDAAETLAGSVGFYGKAVEFDPDNAYYWHMRGRLAYSVWLYSPPDSGPAAREWLFDGLDYTAEALSLDPVDKGDYRPNAWFGTIFDEAVDGTLEQGNIRFGSGEYDSALEYYALVAEEMTDHVQAAFLAGKAALAAGDQAAAAAWLQSGIERANAAGDLAAVQSALADLQSWAGSSSNVDIKLLEELFVKSGIDFSRPASAAVAFDRAWGAWLAGQRAESLELYDQGLSMAAASADLATAVDALLKPLAQPGTGDVLARFARALPQLEAAVSPQALDQAFQIALMAAALGDSGRAAGWYNEAVARAAQQNSYPPIRSSRDDLRQIWRSTGVNSYTLVTGMDRLLPAQLQAAPDLVEDGLFWRFRAWFRYGLGLSAFRLDAPEQAAAALKAAQADAVQAFKLDPANNAYVQSYLQEGAWGWYYMQRGSDYYAEGDFAAALDSYEAAVRNYAPSENSDARDEGALAAFKAGLVSLLLQDLNRASQWYEAGLSLMEEYQSDEWVLETAIDELEALLQQVPDLVDEGEAVLSYLREARL